MLKGLVIAALTVVALVGRSAELRAQEVELWIRAFIPSKHDSNPGYVMEVPGDPSLTMINGPVLGVSDCFLTDQRLFSFSVGASSRIASHVKVRLDGSPKVLLAEHPSSVSVEVDCEDGDEECRKAVDTSRSKIGPVTREGDIIIIRVHGEANNACFSGSPDIHYDGEFRVDVVGKTISFKGSIGQFPAFEAYASLEGGAVIKVFTEDPVSGSSALAVPKSRAVEVSPQSF